jgi:hypothetical protein
VTWTRDASGIGEDAGGGHPGGGERTAHAAVDLETLAERVYRLMLADVRLERGRDGNPVPPARG